MDPTIPTQDPGRTRHHHQGPPPGGGSTDQNGAFAYIERELNAFGLGSLAKFAWREIVAGKDSNQVLLDLYGTQQFKARFPAIFSREAKGLPPISPADYVNYENTATQLMRAAGLPASFWDQPADFTHLIAGDVSVNELQDRIALAQQATYQVPDSVRSVLARDYGIGPGGIAAAFLDPSKADPLLARQFAAAQIGGAGMDTGYATDKHIDNLLAERGITAAQAQQGFSQLAGEKELFGALPGEAGAADISQADQIAAEFQGSAAAQLAIQRRAQERVAALNKGGGYAASSTGFSGVGRSGVQ